MKKSAFRSKLRSFPVGAGAPESDINYATLLAEQAAQQALARAGRADAEPWEPEEPELPERVLFVEMERASERKLIDADTSELLGLLLDQSRGRCYKLIEEALRARGALGKLRKWAEGRTVESVDAVTDLSRKLDSLLSEED